ncbi:MAG TPA: VOC family protein [Steroidobacteraceae bacterium]|jgi:hypothetical protein
MSNADIRGRFIWHELMTTDPDAASAFYTNVIPWKAQPSGMPSYTLWMSGKIRAGGLMALPDGEPAGTPPHWIIYVGTPNVDSTAEAARKLGGKVLKAPADIPNVGRFAVLADPQGAAFAIFTPSPTSGDGVFAGGAVGEFTWHELATTDLDAALRFYSELFGWSKGAGHDMGPMGIYQLISHGGQDVGGIYKARDASSPPTWLSYTRVADAGKAASAVKAGGGRILNGPMEVPGGSWIVMALDPQGGAFAVVEAPRTAKAEGAATAKQPPAAPAKPTPSPPAAAKATAAVPTGKPAAATKPAAAPAAPAKTAAAGAARKSAGRKPVRKAARKAAKKKVAKKAVGKKVAATKKAVAKSSRPKKRSKMRPAATQSPSTRKGSPKGKSGGKRAAARTARGRKHR